MCTVEPPNKGYIGTSHLSIIERLSSLQRLKMHWRSRELSGFFIRVSFVKGSYLF